MELKDVILSTLAEMEEDTLAPKVQQESQVQKKEQFFEESAEVQTTRNATEKESSTTTESELMYLNSIRERLLVLFEGFQAPNNANIEAKVDMTLNFLEYTLATIDSRVQKLEKGQ